jgi:hypothetical protein
MEQTNKKCGLGSMAAGASGLHLCTKRAPIFRLFWLWMKDEKALFFTGSS